MPEKFSTDPPRILFLNQVAGPLFRELAQDLAGEFGDCVLLSGDGYEESWEPDRPLRLLTAPRYDRSSLVSRAFSWVAYFLKAFWTALRLPRQTTLFLVSNPPFLALIGWILRVFRGQRYVVLVYDVYPGLLVGLGRLKEEGWITRVWYWFNQTTWGSAHLIITIGDYMAANVRAVLPEAFAPAVIVVPNWADGGFIRPQDKSENAFARSLGQEDKLTVLYSGNLGDTHDIRTLVAAAARLRGQNEIGFVIIGEGSQRPGIERIIADEKLDNVELLRFQPERNLPNTLTTGDICVVTLDRGIEGYSVPSKTYYMMAAGAALVVISDGPNELTDLLARFDCGVNVVPGDVSGMCHALTGYLNDPDRLQRARANSRAAMEVHFSRANTGRYAAALRRVDLPIGAG